MNKYKIKYGVAVAALMAATAFCGCTSDDEEVIFTDRSIAVAEDAGTEATLTVHEDAVSVPEAKKEMRVYVCGAVKKPGVYTLSPDERLVDAVDAAGGFTEDAGYDYLNLASPISDGQKIYVPTIREIESVLEAEDGTVTAMVNITSNTPGIMSTDNITDSGNTQADATNNDGKVDINTADAATLMTLPGIGKQKAEKIIAYREANGSFSRIEDIMLVGGIKEGLFNMVKDMICVR